MFIARSLHVIIELQTEGDEINSSVAQLNSFFFDTV